MPYLKPSSNQTADLEVIILNFNGKDLLVNCLENLFQVQPQKHVLITVVDNNSTDGSQTLLKNKYQDRVKLIFSEENGGFSRGNNLALRQFKKNRYAFLLNSDASLAPLELNPWDQLIEYMDSHDEVGVLGPKIIDMNGKIEKSTGDTISLTNIIKNKIIKLFRLPVSLSGKLSNVHWAYNRERDAAWVNEADGRKVFYTSLGTVVDFTIPNYRRLLLNGMFWALGKPVPAD